jgi:hypothetical protein
MQSEDVLIHDNEFKLEMFISGYSNVEICGYSSMPSTANIKIYNNKFTKLRTANTQNYKGITAILCTVNVNYEIYNNFIGGFSLSGTPTNPLEHFRGISAYSINTTSIYNNTIYMNDIEPDGDNAGNISIRGIFFGSGTKTIKNNIVYLADDYYNGYCLYQSAAATLASDYNDLYLLYAGVGFTGYSVDSDQTTLANWQAASSQDANSADVFVEFSDINLADFHLGAGSIGDANLAGTSITGLTTDIDGDVRNSPPYMGADENDVTPAPVELTSFTATSVNSESIVLNWTTATEVRNYGFEIQKSVVRCQKKNGV